MNRRGFFGRLFGAAAAAIAAKALPPKAESGLMLGGKPIEEVAVNPPWFDALADLKPANGYTWAVPKWDGVEGGERYMIYADERGVITGEAAERLDRGDIVTELPHGVFRRWTPYPP